MAKPHQHHSKEDKKFLINLSIYNRDFLLGINSVRLSMAVALTAVLTSLFSILLSLRLIDAAYASLLSLIVLAVIWIGWWRSSKKMRQRLDMIHSQYKDYIEDLYPELKDSDFHY
jgi:hypothetical protein